MEEKNPFLVVETDGINDFYKDVLDSIIDRGYEISPRGLPTKEIRPVMVIINKPRERFLTCPGRLIHPFFQVMESIWILGGRGDVNFIEYYLSNMKTYADGEREFNAPYGTRMRKWNDHRSIQFCTGRVVDQFADCYKALERDLSTRQAVMVFWNPNFDNYRFETNDRPCNISFQFLVRNGKLDLTIFNRSNDISWGLANANVVQFSVILEAMAMLLDIPVGSQIHMINSLHAYNFQGETTKRVLDAKYDFNVYDYVEPSPFFLKIRTIEELNYELEIFFDAEEAIRNGNVNILLPDDSVTFNYLKEALVLAKSFYYYKKEDYIKSAKCLLDLKADDIFVTTMEFIARKVGSFGGRYYIFKDFISERFSDESSKAILKYIEDH